MLRDPNPNSNPDPHPRITYTAPVEPTVPKQPPYNAQAAVNLLRMERLSRPGGGKQSLKSYWQWGDKENKNDGGGGDGSDMGSHVQDELVRPMPKKVETEADRIANVRRMQTLYLENAKQHGTNGPISRAVDLSLYTAAAAAAATAPSVADTQASEALSAEAKQMLLAVTPHIRRHLSSTMSDSIQSFPPTPDSMQLTGRLASAAEGEGRAGSSGGFLAPFVGSMAVRKPKTPNIKDMDLQEDDLLLVSKYFNRSQGTLAGVSAAENADTLVHGPLSPPTRGLGLSGSRDGLRLGSAATATPGTADGEAGLLQWTNTLDLGSIESL